jgi:hypothetical protein
LKLTRTKQERPHFGEAGAGKGGVYRPHYSNQNKKAPDDSDAYRTPAKDGHSGLGQPVDKDAPVANFTAKVAQNLEIAKFSCKKKANELSDL